MNDTPILRDGTPVVRRHSALDAELRTLRTSVALADLAHLGMTVLDGADAWDLADRVLPRDLFLRDHQARQTLMLDEQGRAIVDVLVCNEDDRLLLVTEGMPPSLVRERLRDAVRPGEDVDIVALDETHHPIEVTGPFAWELMGRLAGPGILGQPYLTLSTLDDGVRCLRAGRTGEFAYDLLVPRERVGAVRARLRELGGDLDLAPIGQDALDRAALENWFFDMHAEGRRGLTPLHLQLQWRISRTKSFIGSEALAAWRARGLDRRITAFRGPAGVAADQPIHVDDQCVGDVVVAAPDSQSDGTLGLALLDLEAAVVGLDALEALGPAGPLRLRTVAPPFVVNRSLGVKPQRHSYAARDQIVWPRGTWS